MIGIMEKMIEAAKSDLAHEKARGPHQNNLVIAIAAHKIAWLKELKREFENAEKPRQP
jgi:hypothetical protein